MKTIPDKSKKWNLGKQVQFYLKSKYRESYSGNETQLDGYVIKGKSTSKQS